MAKTEKEQLALEIIERLRKEYPDADCTLDYDEAWKLLVSVRLAAQCTDERVNIVVEKLFEKYPNVKALADADVDNIEVIVRPCGLGRSKARDISACMKVLRDQYDCQKPNMLPNNNQLITQSHVAINKRHHSLLTNHLRYIALLSLKYHIVLVLLRFQ